MRRVKVGQILELQRRQVEVDPARDYLEIGVRSFGRGIFHKEPVRGIDLGNKRVFEIHPGDLVFSNVFSWEGAVALATVEDAGRIGSHRFMTYIPRADDVDAGYLRYYFTSERGIAQLGQASPGSAGRNRTLAVERFEAIEVPLPDIDVQRSVAAHLDRVSALLGRVGEALAQLDECPAGELLPGLIDDVLQAGSSDQTRAGELYDVVADVVHPGDAYDGATSFVGLQHVESHTGRRLGSLPLGGETGRKFRFEPGDVVYGYLRPYLNKVWVADRIGLCSVDQYVLRPKAGVDSRLLSYCLRSRNTLAQAEELTHNLQLPRLRTKLLSGVAIADPRSQPEGTVERLDRLTETVERLARLRAKRDQLTKSILPAALNCTFDALE